jgi:hypothetical protein
MVKKKRPRRKPASALKRQAQRGLDSAARASLEGLRDALDLTLTRVIEDDMGVDEARAVLRYLEKELDGFERRSRADKTPAQKVRRRATAARRSKRMGER